MDTLNLSSSSSGLVVTNNNSTESSTTTTSASSTTATNNSNNTNNSNTTNNTNQQQNSSPLQLESTSTPSTNTTTTSNDTTTTIANSTNNNNNSQQQVKVEESSDDSLSCPICLDMLKEPFISKCGHSYCYQCITTHLSKHHNCPLCSNYLNRDQIFPNFALNNFVEKLSSRNNLISTPPIKQFHNTLSNENLSISDINQMVSSLLEKRKQLELQDQQVELDILLDFLNKTKSQKIEAFKQLKRQISYLDQDISSIEKQKDNPTDKTSNSVNKLEKTDSSEELLLSTSTSSTNTTFKPKPTNSLSIKKRRIDTHLDDLQNCYFSVFNDTEKENLEDNGGTSTSSNNNNLNLTTLKYGDLFNASSIVSSIEFDRDDEFFATAGVTKKIKIFEYAKIREHVEVHSPIKEMTCRSKISCLSWNTYLKSQIASSDYEGIISLWDVNTGQNVMSFEEHEKRVWSVDFSRTDPTQLASGSDDTRVKLWSTNTDRAVITIDSKANICCVKFNPSSSNYIAFGSADHHIHYYDLRKPKEPLYIFKGHRKAVSYVKFMNKDEIISASTDSTLKLWDVNQPECVRTFTGHANEKNFVGLTVNGDYICCGSENNGVYTYFKALSKPIVTHRFGANSGTGEETDDDGSQFVSSVCWKKDSNVLLAANSQGTIKVLELL
eukprot:gene2491-3083_t